MLLTRAELIELTGYRQRRCQIAWLREHLRIVPPLRADGLPVVTHAQVEAALAGHARNAAAAGPNWSKIAA
jgi:hypothetical protein